MKKLYYLHNVQIQTPNQQKSSHNTDAAELLSSQTDVVQEDGSEEKTSHSIKILFPISSLLMSSYCIHLSHWEK